MFLLTDSSWVVLDEIPLAAADGGGGELDRRLSLALAESSTKEGDLDRFLAAVAVMDCG